MVDIGIVLRHYKRPDIQQAMLEASRDREVAVRYADKGFGKRPDTLQYPNDILEFAKQRATSFHVSEERWSNPLHLDTGMKPKELDELRVGWDLILDVDIPDWKLSKIITWLLIEALKKHSISSVSVKFSGNKGFHIGVPYEAFPKNINGKDTSSLFPDICKKISLYLIDYISKHMISIDGEEVTFNKHYTFTLQAIADSLGKEKDELTQARCIKCQKKRKKTGSKRYQFICPACSSSITSDEEYMACSRCSTLMERKSASKDDGACSCGESQAYNAFNALEVVEVDTILISSRHMYRLVYSLHEKSSLASVPLDPDKVLLFKKEMAQPDDLKISPNRFLDTSTTKENEALALAEKALAFDSEEKEIEERREQYVNYDKEQKNMKEFEELQEEVPADFFPPCIGCILKGIEDGKKRAVFILSNFFANTGYSWEKIDRLLEEWNKRNTEELREVIIKGQIRYRKNKKKVLPPNCDNKAYYKDMQCCTPDNFCQRIKNPVNYAVLKAKIANAQGKKGRQKLTEEQKEMRRKYRNTKKDGEKQNKQKEQKKEK